MTLKELLDVSLTAMKGQRPVRVHRPMRPPESVYVRRVLEDGSNGRMCLEVSRSKNGQASCLYLRSGDRLTPE